MVGNRMNKRGFMFSFILFLVTIMMCLLSVGIYVNQQEKVQSSLVSPLVVLEVRDALDVFEMREVELIETSLENVESDFGSEEFLDEFRTEFFSGIDDEMKEFLFWNVTLNGKALGNDFDEVAFLENVVYGSSLSSIDYSGLKFGRGKIGKSFELRAQKMKDVNFPVDFGFDFSREYLISKRGSGFDVEVLE
ncbi:MAG: hypothetical protein V1888_01520 [archaeon]